MFTLLFALLWNFFERNVYDMIWRMCTGNPLPPVDDYPSYDECLEDKMEDYQNCSVLYCVPLLYSVMHSRMRSSTGELGPVGLGLVSFCACFCVYLTIASLFVIGLVILCFCVLYGCCLVVSTSAMDCLERLVPKMTCCVCHSPFFVHSQSWHKLVWSFFLETGSHTSWKVMEFTKGIFQAWKVMENDCGHGKS